jgi:hypothetical protein
MKIHMFIQLKSAEVVCANVFCAPLPKNISNSESMTTKDVPSTIVKSSTLVNYAAKYMIRYFQQANRSLRSEYHTPHHLTPSSVRYNTTNEMVKTIAMLYLEKYHN